MSFEILPMNDPDEPSYSLRTSSFDFLKTFQAVLQGIVDANGDSSELQDGSSEDCQMLDLLNRPDLKALISLHQFVSEHRFRNAGPLERNLLDIVGKCTVFLLRESPLIVGVQELVQLLNKAHILTVFSAHDYVANRRFSANLPSIPHEVDDDEGLAIKVVRLVKRGEPLGATITCESKGEVYIARVIRGGVADRSGCIQVGDRVVEVNGISVTGKVPKEIVHLLTDNNGTVTFKLVPAFCNFDPTKSTNCSQVGFNRGCLPTDEDESKLRRMRAQFSYNSLHDSLHPCPEAGLSFANNDILQLVDCQDEHWWQARIEPFGKMSNSADKVGLIPSQKLQEQRYYLQKKTHFDTLKSGKTVRKFVYESQQADYIEDSQNCRAYEEVSLLYPGPNLVRQGLFLEYGEYRGNLYGTLASSVTLLLQQGRVPVLNPHPQALKLLRNAVFKPFVVFVKPASFAVLKETRSTNRSRSTFEAGYQRGFSDDELEQMLISSANLDRQYGHWFDYQLINVNLEFAFRELCDILQRVNSEPHWVPFSWVN